jgi:uncharacterized protein YcfL
LRVLEFLASLPNAPTMRTLLLFLSLFILTGCKDTPSASTPPETPAEALNASELTTVLAPLIDPAKLDTLKGKRAATPRLRKACYWLQMAHVSGFDAGETARNLLLAGGP